jgi:hypothetical protein
MNYRRRRIAESRRAATPMGQAGRERNTTSHQPPGHSREATPRRRPLGRGSGPVRRSRRGAAHDGRAIARDAGPDHSVRAGRGPRVRGADPGWSGSATASTALPGAPVRSRRTCVAQVRRGGRPLPRRLPRPVWPRTSAKAERTRSACQPISSSIASSLRSSVVSHSRVFPTMTLACPTKTGIILPTRR